VTETSERTILGDLEALIPPCRFGDILNGGRAQECGKPVTHALTLKCGPIHLACTSHAQMSMMYPVLCEHGYCSVTKVEKL
jgi:hypothetical protein